MSVIKFESQIAGIPCVINVVYYKKVVGSMSYNAPSDLDYYGYTDVDWEICDLKEKLAPWLQKKLTIEDFKRIESEINQAMEEKYED